jgi:RNA polymerase sigma-70 factor, ECF subfamily
MVARTVIPNLRDPSSCVVGRRARCPPRPPPGGQGTGVHSYPAGLMDETTRLLLAAADGDTDALATFVRRTQADVWRFCAHLVDPGAADDLTQEVYLRAMRSIPRFRGDASARTWLLAVARNVAADEIRRRQRRRRLPDPVVDDVPDHAGHVELHDLLDHLDDDRREAFVLTQLLGLPYADAAAACDVPIGTIRSRVARAREQLVALLDEQDGAARKRHGGSPKQDGAAPKPGPAAPKPGRAAGQRHRSTGS